jgi:hypothetical protein
MWLQCLYEKTNHLQDEAEHSPAFAWLGGVHRHNKGGWEDVPTLQKKRGYGAVDSGGSHNHNQGTVGCS